MAAVRSISTDDSIIMGELEVLESIYIDELKVENDESGYLASVTLQLHPATGEDVDRKFVCMTLTLNLPPLYPEMLPEVIIRNPRGIGEEELESLHEAINELAEERRGGHMLYDIIELAKESLTEGNVPHCPCTICLDHFSEGEEFMRTECYHYFHCHCLYRYITHTLHTLKSEAQQRPKHENQGCHGDQKVPCPVCREVITYNLDLLSNGGSQVKDEGHQNYKPSGDIRKWQVEMAAILKSQEEKGGIIDLEAERNKYLVTAEDIIELPRQGSNSDLESLGKTAKDDKIPIGDKLVSSQGRGNSVGGAMTRGDRPRSGSGVTDRKNQYRYRGHRFYDPDGQRLSERRYRDGYKSSNKPSNNRGQGHEKGRGLRDIQQGDEGTTDGQYRGTSSKMKEVNTFPKCQDTKDEVKVENESSTINRNSPDELSHQKERSNEDDVSDRLGTLNIANKERSTERCDKVVVSVNKISTTNGRPNTEESNKTSDSRKIYKPVGMRNNNHTSERNHRTDDHEKWKKPYHGNNSNTNDSNVFSHQKEGQGHSDRGQGHSDRGRRISDRGQAHSERSQKQSSKGQGYSERDQTHSSGPQGHSDRRWGHSDRGQSDSYRRTDRGQGYYNRIQNHVDRDQGLSKDGCENHSDTGADCSGQNETTRSNVKEKDQGSDLKVVDKLSSEMCDENEKMWDNRHVVKIDSVSKTERDTYKFDTSHRINRDSQRSGLSHQKNNEMNRPENSRNLNEDHEKWTNKHNGNSGNKRYSGGYFLHKEGQGHSNRGQGQSDRGRGRGSRRSANQQISGNKTDSIDNSDGKKLSEPQQNNFDSKGEYSETKSQKHWSGSKGEQSETRSQRSGDKGGYSDIISQRPRSGNKGECSETKSQPYNSSDRGGYSDTRSPRPRSGNKAEHSETISEHAGDKGGSSGTSQRPKSGNKGDCTETKSQPYNSSDRRGYSDTRSQRPRSGNKGEHSETISEHAGDKGGSSGTSQRPKSGNKGDCTETKSQPYNSSDRRGYSDTRSQRPRSGNKGEHSETISEHAGDKGGSSGTSQRPKSGNKGECSETKSQPYNSSDRGGYSDTRSQRPRSGNKGELSETKAHRSSPGGKYSDTVSQRFSYDNKVGHSESTSERSSSGSKVECSEARSLRPSSGYVRKGHGFGRPKERTGKSINGNSESSYDASKEESRRDQHETTTDGSVDVHLPTCKNDNDRTRRVYTSHGGNMRNRKESNTDSKCMDDDPDRYAYHQHNTCDRSDTGEEKTRSAPPGFEVKRLPPGFALVAHSHDHVKIPPGF